MLDRLVGSVLISFSLSFKLIAICSLKFTLSCSGGGVGGRV